MQHAGRPALQVLPRPVHPGGGGEGEGGGGEGEGGGLGALLGGKGGGGKGACLQLPSTPLASQSSQNMYGAYPRFTS